MSSVFSRSIWLWLGGWLTQEEVAFAESISRPEVHVLLDGGSDNFLSLYTPSHDSQRVILIGDLDTLKDPERLKVLPSLEVIRYPKDKDLTDLELALKFISERPEKGDLDLLLILGALSLNRPDLVLSNFISIYQFNQSLPRLLLIFREGVGLLLRGGAELKLELPLGSKVSLISFSFFKASSKGLKYQLDNLTLNPGGRGVSNETIQREVWISALEGGVWCFIFTRDLKFLRWDVR